MANRFVSPADAHVYTVEGNALLPIGSDDTAVVGGLCEAMEAHEILRTSFVPREGRLECVVREELDPVEGGNKHPFDLGADSLVRFNVSRRGIHPLLRLTLHQIVADSVAAAVLADEVAIRVAGNTALLPPGRYESYATQERATASAGGFDRAIAEWQSELSEAPPIDLPYDRPRPALQSHARGVHPFRLNPRLSRAIFSVASTWECSWFDVVFAAFVATLSRLANAESLVVGLPTDARRLDARMRSTLGFFVNPLPLLLHVGNATFESLIDQVRERRAEVLKRQSVPFELLVERLDRAHDASRPPLLQVTCQELPALENIEDVGARWPSSSFKFDLSLNVVTRRGLINGWLDFDRSLFQSRSIALFTRRLAQLAHAAVETPTARIGGLSVLDRREHREIRRASTGDRRDISSLTLCQLIRGVAQRAPDAPAVVFGDEAISYETLLRRSQSLACTLRSSGLGRQTIVGVCLERSIDLPVALLAVLEAGAAFLPLEPSSPPERLTFMVQEAADAVITTPSLVGLVEGTGARTVLMGVSEAEPEPADADAQADDLAYCIYTSGSTGRPKGVLIEHGAIVNRLEWMQNKYTLEYDDVVLHKTPIGFDVSIWELFWPLIAAAKLAIALPGRHRDPRYLTETINRFGVTTVHFVPSLLRAFLDEPSSRTCKVLRRVICSGEALPPEVRTNFFNAFGREGPELHNLYGPTEAAIDVTYHACMPGEDLIPIGRPIFNMSIHVIDDNGGPSPIGVAGELCLSGVGLARGYLNREDLTQQRFVSTIIDGQPVRLYRTGDIGRMNVDGEFEFLGRRDNQLKLRGQRIELGEVESVLASHPHVQAAAVGVDRTGDGDMRLIAYLVTGADRTETTDLREYLRRKLPEYMIPSAYVRVGELPLTSSGKIDRARLPRPPAPTSTATKFETATEMHVAAVVGEVLGVEDVGADDDFFELGGHSLHAITVASKLSVLSGADLPLEDVFLLPVVRDLAARVDSIRDSC